MAYVELTKDNFEQIVTENDMVIVDFWAEWCGPCKMFGPVFEKVSEDHPDAVFAKVNTEVEQEIASWFQIRSIPTLMIFREKIIIFSQAGALPEGSFRQVIEKAKELDMVEVKKQVAEQQAQQSQ
ncbi:MAG: thioredoxin [Chromatiales bacterium]|nr:thioredoxin [Zoogloeaceae bacterium]MCP5352673.1 thioredoxin [Chromatiales bacterium]